MRAQERDREACFRAFFAAAYDDLLRFVQRRVDPSQAEDVGRLSDRQPSGPVSKITGAHHR